MGRGETRWQQRAKAIWLKQGDRNTTFFHAIANERRQKKEIKRLKDGSAIDEILSTVEPRVTDTMNESFLQPFSADEVIKSLNQMHPYKLSGPDEVFSSKISQAERTRPLKGVAVSRGASRVSHLLFADDTLIFCQATKEALECVHQLLDCFERASRLKINHQNQPLFLVTCGIPTNSQRVLRQTVNKHPKYLEVRLEK
ncbi:UNVERIFIED_CONTAM: hypothetical protein Slati_0204100 [Sesamum latifolium]|uniref:Reverse transcriptase domain-containing protein n=1 Tax=Sesamum latifolium TaxID=2727402 RepID=A0AAW2YBF3_9LAMI